jgi:foldase protein PrsA
MIVKKLIYVGVLTALIMTVTACAKKTDTDEKGVKTETAVVKDAGSENESSQSIEQEDSASVDESAFDNLVVSVGKEAVYYSEAMIYFKYIEAQYQSYFGDQIWAYDFGGQTFGDMAKQEIIDMIAQTKIIDAHAEMYNVTLEEEDELLIQQNAENFLEGLTAEDKTRYGLTEEIAQIFYRDNMLYEKVYDAATMEVNTDVSDEEAKQIRVQHILVSTTDTDIDGTVTPMSEDRKAIAYAKAKKLRKEAKTTEDFYTFAEANTADSEVEYTFGKGEMPEAFEKVAFALNTGELSGIVETQEGYNNLYCVSDYDEDATLEKKEEIIEARQDESFQDLYEKWSLDFKVNVNEKVWDTMIFTEKAAEESIVKPTEVPTEG